MPLFNKTASSFTRRCIILRLVDWLLTSLGGESGTGIISVLWGIAPHYCGSQLCGWCKQLQVYLSCSRTPGSWSAARLSQKLHISEPLQRSGWKQLRVWCRTLIRGICPSGSELCADDELSDWATVCTDSKLRGFLSSSSPWDPSTSLSGVGMWERGRREKQGQKKKKGKAAQHMDYYLSAFQAKVNCRCACVWPTRHVCF